MSDYIDRRDVLRKIKDKCCCGAWDKMHLCDAIMNIHAVDVAPVQHGTWDAVNGTKTRRECSFCGWDVPEYGKFYAYCPNCGAKMDGRREDV